MQYGELVSSWALDRRDRGLFHDLMRWRVREILIIGSLYDSFVVEADGFLTEQMYGEYSRLNLTSMPRFTSAYTEESALDRFGSGSFDLVIIMAGLDVERPLRLAMELRARSPTVPLLLLVLNNSTLAELDTTRPEFAFFDRTFVWNGYSKLLVGMIKYVEDSRNADADTGSGLVRAILLIEDSVRYYSRYLPLIYSILLKQTQDLIEEESGVETYRLLRARTRPKILLASSFEEAEATFTRHEGSILALITDLRFMRAGRFDPEAGFAFARFARSRKADLPVLVQSSEAGVRATALAIGASFVEKSSESLAHELGDFIRSHLGFGPFSFQDGDGKTIATARTMEELSQCLRSVPASCTTEHARRNDFSTWLGARGEYRFASILRGMRVDDFASSEDIRSFLVRVVDHVRLEKAEGLLPEFAKEIYSLPGSLSRIGSGSVGGKGRGLEFIARVVETERLDEDYPGLSIAVPRSAFIGIDLFEEFLEKNGLWSEAYYGEAGGGIADRFARSEFPERFLEPARRFLAACHVPVALRSSGLLEDMVMVPMAGAYETVFLPNDGPDIEARLSDFLAGIKLVWASLFSSLSRSHIEVSGYQLEEERMAVVVQELAGHRDGSLFAPTAAGIAFSALNGEGPGFALSPGFGSQVSGAGKGIFMPLGNPSFSGLDWPDSYPVLRLDGTGNPQSSDSLPLSETAVTHAASRSSAEAAGERVLAALHDSGACAALDHLLGMVGYAYGNQASIEFAFDLVEGAKPRLELLQVRPLCITGGLPSLGAPVASTELQILAEGRLFGSFPQGQIRDIVVLQPGAQAQAQAQGPTEESRRGDPALRALDRAIAAEGRGYVLAGLGLPFGSLVFPDVANATLVLDLAPADMTVESAVPSLGSHFSSNLIAAGSGWLHARSLYARPLDAEGSPIAWLPPGFTLAGSSGSWLRFGAPGNLSLIGKGELVMLVLTRP
ncbi:MAG: PEP/pyruvate-binding domain-containing protein [Rectinemataceae bacterium]